MILHGRQAVDAVEKQLGRLLNDIEHRVVMVEGCSTKEYFCSAGVLTNNVGQTGVWLNKTFPQALEYHIQRVRNRLPAYDSYPEYLKRELVQSEYRGDLGLSPKAMRLVRGGMYDQAAIEFLDHKEYRDTNSKGIRKRIEAVSHALNLYDCELH